MVPITQKSNSKQGSISRDIEPLGCQLPHIKGLKVCLHGGRRNMTWIGLRAGLGKQIQGLDLIRVRVKTGIGIDTGAKT